MKQALSEVELFIRQTCGHRPSSHSDEHMQKVVSGAQEIYRHEHPDRDPMSDPLYFMVTATCWLHDVADHKYVDQQPGLLNEIYAFLCSFTKKYRPIVAASDYEYLFNPQSIIAITERFSFSREKKYGIKDWSERLGKHGITIRDYGSDSDKWQAIGRRGIVRCKDYTLEKAAHDNISLTHGELVGRVTTHYHEKLKLLSTHYMKTELGKSRGRLLDLEMKQALVDLEKGCL